MNEREDPVMTACEKAIRYLLAKMDEEAGDVMTLPVLQKLLYYSQVFLWRLPESRFSKRISRCGRWDQ